MACHFRLDLDGVEGLSSPTGHCHLVWLAHRTYFAVVYADDAADHLGDDDHVAEVGLDDGGFLVREGLFFGFAEFLDEAHWAALEAAVELAACTRVDELEWRLEGGRYV